MPKNKNNKTRYLIYWMKWETKIGMDLNLKYSEKREVKRKFDSK